MDWLLQSQPASQPSAPDTGLRIQTAVQGKPRPIGCGQIRVAGNLIGTWDFQSQQQDVSTGGGKGGVVSGGKGGATQTVYSVAVLFALCEGPIDSVVQYWNQQNASPLATLGPVTVLDGDYAQSPWSYLVSLHPDQADNNRGVACVGIGPVQLGTSSALPNWSWEILFTIKDAISGLPDADPAEWVTELLTNAHWSIHFPNANLDALTLYSNWCKSTGMVISDILVSQIPLNNYLQKLLEATASEFVWSGGILKIVPYGDIDVTGNGFTYTAPAFTGVDLGADDMLPVQQSSLNPNIRVQCTVPNRQDSDNWVQVQYQDRTNDYNKVVVEAKDEASIAELEYALNQAGTRDYSFFTTQNAAIISAHLQLGRETVRNQYYFSLTRSWARLEPMDIVTINDDILGLNQFPVRIKEITENQDGSFDVVAEEFLIGTGSPYGYVTATQPAICSPDFNSDPGPTVFAAWDATLCAVPDGPALIVAAAGSGISGPGGTIYLNPGATSVTIPSSEFTVECWGPGANAGIANGGGSGAYTRKRYVNMTAGASYAVNIPVANTSGDKWTWFDSITTQKAHGGSDNGVGGDPTKCIGDVIFAGGQGGGLGGGGAGAAGPGGPGRDGGLGANDIGVQAGGGGGGGQGGGSDGDPGIVGPLGPGGDGGENALGQPGGAHGIPGSGGSNATADGAGGGGGGFNGAPGGNGKDDIDGGGGGGGGGNRNTGSGTGGTGGFPGGGGGHHAPANTTTAVGAGGQIKISYGLICDPGWGATDVYISTDGGSSYVFNQTIPGPSPIGVATAAFPSGSDPDTTHTLAVNVSNSLTTMGSFSQSDADAGRSRAIIDSEIIDFTNVVLTGDFAYHLDTYIRRGRLGTAIASHGIGAKFAVLGRNAITIKYPISLIGSTIKAKFTARNASGGGLQSLADVPEHTITLVGPGDPAAPSSLTATQAAAGAPVLLSWPASQSCGVNDYILQYDSGGPTTTIDVGNVLSYVLALPAASYNFAIIPVNSAGLQGSPATTTLVVT